MAGGRGRRQARAGPAGPSPIGPIRRPDRVPGAFVPAFVLAFVSIAASEAPAQERARHVLGEASRGEVLSAVDGLFRAMAAGDSAAARAAFHPDVRLTRVADDPGGVEPEPVAATGFLSGLGSAEVAWRERIWDAEVRVDGNLAAVWAPYDFHRGDEFSHCGIDALHLVRTRDGWKILAIAWTARSEPCRPPP